MLGLLVLLHILWDADASTQMSLKAEKISDVLLFYIYTLAGSLVPLSGAPRRHLFPSLNLPKFTSRT